MTKKVMGDVMGDVGAFAALGVGPQQQLVITTITIKTGLF